MAGIALLVIFILNSADLDFAPSLPRSLAPSLAPSRPPEGGREAWREREQEGEGQGNELTSVYLLIQKSVYLLIHTQ